MPKIENFDLVDQFNKKNLKKSKQQTEDDLRVESGGPLGVRQRKGEIPPTGSRRFKKEIGMQSIKKIVEPEDVPHTFIDIESREEIENPEEVILEGIDKRHKKRKEHKRYYGIRDRRKRQQKQYKLNVKIKSGEVPPPIRIWRHPSLEESSVNENLKRVAKRQDKVARRGARWPIIEEKRKPAGKK